MDNEFKDRIRDVEIKDEMEKSYISYAMSVIIGRALPDVRDGLKPVHRRILYSMGEQGLTPDKKHRKSATVVGDVMGKYHPHGDSPIYETMVKMAQKFAIRYPLVDGQGNFGTIDGDSAAAMRYTEARMTHMALEMLRDLNKETVDMGSNFDENEEEPKVLPSRYPNLLVNGSNGIAVGMATSIPPHNLGEVIDAVVELIDNEEATVEDLMKHIQGPDFPTGAYIMGRSGMLNAYRTGRGRVVQRAKTEIEEIQGGKNRIVITEIPYQVNKARMVEKIAELVKDRKIDGITDLRDESNRKGIRVVVETRRDVNVNIVLNNLFKHSQLQQSFPINMLAIVDGQPKVLGLLEIIKEYLKHQEDVVTRRTKFDLKKAQDRIHILEALLKAIDHIDEVIAIIRSSYDDAQQKLMERFDFSEVQAQAILDMRMRRLQGLEREKLEDERSNLAQKIEYYLGLLADRQKLLGVIKEEILEIKNKHNDGRRTEILESEEDLEDIDMIDDEDVTITLTHNGYIKRMPIDTYKAQKRGGKGVASMTTREEDFVEVLITSSNHAKAIFLTNQGRLYRMPVYKIPQSNRTSKGTNIINLIPLEPGEKITTLLSLKNNEDSEKLVMCTKLGIIKKTELSEFRKSSRNGLIAINLREDDEMISAKITTGEDNLVVVSRNGKSITFSEKDIRQTGRVSMGVIAMRLDENDAVISMEVVEESKNLLVITENGYGKKTSTDEYRTQTRGGKGIKTYNVTEQTGFLVGARMLSEGDEIMIVNSDGTLIRMSESEIPCLSRATKGVRLMRSADSKIVSFEKIEAGSINDEEEDIKE
ncbi:MAG: DNA gyrase subunit A [Peptostreptococcaceae bacterium]|nr:DNA gyrase subunit A [Peptostreptococcaceae bacterium]